MNELWQALTLHADDYATFCDAAWAPAVPPADARGRRRHDKRQSQPLLLATLRCGRLDEGGGPSDLPLLFRVDQELQVHDGNRYLVDCGVAASASRFPTGSACNTSKGRVDDRSHAAFAAIYPSSTAATATPAGGRQWWRRVQRRRRRWRWGSN
ncbi:hypothetical protein NKG94_09860 [Micromonospora sp. M12]